MKKELAGLSEKALRMRAVDVGASFDAIEESHEVDDPKAFLIAAILEQVEQAPVVGEKAKEAAALSEHRSNPHHGMVSRDVSERLLVVAEADINGQGAVRENHYDMDGADDY